jgi:hypothetical protein
MISGATRMGIRSAPAAPDALAAQEVIDTVAGIWKARALYAGARLGLADHLGAGLHSVNELAAATGTHAPSLLRLMRALASMGLFTEVAPERFDLAPRGAVLRESAPGAVLSTVLTLGGDWQWQAWGCFLHSLRTGEAGMNLAHGARLFDYLAVHPEDSAHFNRAMVGIHGADGAALVDAYDFSNFESIVDLGGGTGVLLTTILNSNGRLRGVLFDLPETSQQARALVAYHGLAARCDVVAGDFFASVPDGHDAYVLAHVLHDWSDEEALPILRNCRRAMTARAKLLILEHVLPAGDTPHPGKLMDLLMLTVTGGVERTADAFTSLLAQADLQITRFIPVATGQTVIEAEVRAP